jgi:hypothetical protein
VNTAADGAVQAPAAAPVAPTEPTDKA